MAKSFLLTPEVIRNGLAQRFRRRAGHWLSGADPWPLRLPLGVPSEREAAARLDQVRAWQSAWTDWRGPGAITWCERRWPGLGTQRLPESVAFDEPRTVAGFIGEEHRWFRARQRFDAVVEQWPGLGNVAAASTDVLMDWDEAEFERLLALLDWLTRNAKAHLYPRQVPVTGLDSKWLEGRRRVLGSWLRPLVGSAAEPGADLYELAGLRHPPQTLRMRLLDPSLRAHLGGLGDIQAPVAQLAALRLPAERVLIVENLQTGLAFEALVGTVLFMGQGYAVEPFAELPWLRGLPCLYWGDIDTHGFAILDRLRTYLPQTRSLLMDQGTLLAHRALWVHEPRPARIQTLTRLDPDERTVFTGLVQNRWGPNLRLEQERIDWAYAMARLPKRGR